MTPLYLKLLLVIFLIHLAVFARMALRTRRGYHRSLALVFVCLIGMVGLRLWVPNLSLGALPFWYPFRWGAWAFTLLTVVQWLRYRWGGGQEISIFHQYESPQQRNPGGRR